MTGRVQFSHLPVRIEQWDIKKLKFVLLSARVMLLASKYFESSWFRFLDNCQILLKINLIKPDHLLFNIKSNQ